jgi:tetratricopeptide (TPR) repeat protein
MRYLIIIFFFFIIGKVYGKDDLNLINGKNFYAKKKYNSAKFEFEKSIVLNPKNSEAYFYLSKVYGEQNNTLEQEKNLKNVLLINPKNEDALFEIIKLNIKKADFKKANENFMLYKKFCLKCQKIVELDREMEKINK